MRIIIVEPSDELCFIAANRKIALVKFSLQVAFSIRCVIIHVMLHGETRLCVCLKVEEN